MLENEYTHCTTVSITKNPDAEHEWDQLIIRNPFTYEAVNLKDFLTRLPNGKYIANVRVTIEPVAYHALDNPVADLVEVN